MIFFTKLSFIGFLATFSYFLARYPILPLYAEKLGLSPAEIGLVVSASSITGILFKIQMGALSDILGRRKLLLISMLFFSFTPFLYQFCHSPISLFSLRIIHGFATAIFAPVTSAIISDFANKNERGKLLSLFSSTCIAGETIGPVLCGYLLFMSGFFLPYLMSGIIGISALILSIFLYSDQENTIYSKDGFKEKFINGIRVVFNDKSIFKISAIECVVFFISGAYEGFLPIYAKNHVHLLSWQIGTLFGISSVSIMLFKPFWGAFSDKYGRKAQILFGLITSGTAFAIIPFSHSFTFMLLVIAIYGFSISAISSATSPLITDLVKKENYGSAHGFFGTVADFGHASGSILAGLIISSLNYDFMFYVLGLVLFVSGLLYFLFKD